MNYQYGLILTTVVCFGLFFQSGLSVFFGGLISIANAIVFTQQVNQQKYQLMLDGKSSFRLMIKSVLVRMTLVVVLIAIGLMLVNNPRALIIGLAVGQIGFLLDSKRILK